MLKFEVLTNSDVPEDLSTKVIDVTFPFTPKTMSIRCRTGTLDEEAIADERCMLDNPWCSLCWKLMGLDTKMVCPLKTDGP